MCGKPKGKKKKMKENNKKKSVVCRHGRVRVMYIRIAANGKPSRADHVFLFLSFFCGTSKVFVVEMSSFVEPSIF